MNIDIYLCSTVRTDRIVDPGVENEQRASALLVKPVPVIVTVTCHSAFGPVPCRCHAGPVP